MLAVEVSEDEANKKRVGDLNYFSAGRMPEDFVAAASERFASTKSAGR